MSNVWNAKVPDEIILEELKRGLTLPEIRNKYGLCASWVNGSRAHQLAMRAKKEQREQEQKNLHPVTTYRLSPEEIERRYGLPGTLAEKKEYTFAPESPKKAENRQIDE